jgi:hypothetical protein
MSSWNDVRVISLGCLRVMCTPQLVTYLRNSCEEVYFLRIMDFRNGSQFTVSAGSPSLHIDRSKRPAAMHIALPARLRLRQHRMESCWESENTPLWTNYSSQNVYILQQRTPCEQFKLIRCEAFRLRKWHYFLMWRQPTRGSIFTFFWIMFNK